MKRPAARERRVTFTVSYPGRVASSNNGYVSTIVTRKDGSQYARPVLVAGADAYKQECFYAALEAWSVSKWLPKPGDVLYIGLQGRFPTKRHCDIENLRKFIQDSIKEALDHKGSSRQFYSDRDWLPTKGQPSIYERGCKPTITVTVEG